MVTRFLKKKIKGFFYQLFPEIKKVVNDKEKIVNNSKLADNCKIYPKSRISNSTIGSYTYVSENSIINNTTIGKFCSIGPNLISGWGIHPTKGISTHPMFYSTRKQNGVTLCVENKIDEIVPIKIGNDVFIGMNVTILDGITIGDGAVIGAGAVVSKNIPPFAIAVGNPIKIMKYRFEDDIIIRMMELKWWENEKNLQSIEQNFFKIENYLSVLENSKPI